MEAASSFETGAAFAAFRENFQPLLLKHGLRLKESCDPEEVFRGMFDIFKSTLQDYFVSLQYKAIKMPKEWQGGIMTVILDNHQAETMVPDESRVFIAYAKQFFPVFFRGFFCNDDGTQTDVDKAQAAALTELAVGVIATFFVQKAVSFPSANLNWRERAYVVH